MSNEFNNMWDRPDQKDNFQRNTQNTPFTFADTESSTEADLLPDEEFGNDVRPKQQISGYEYDIAVIGSGPAGYTAAVSASQLGAKVIMFEKEALGGLWLNAGCVPAKIYLKSADILRSVKSASDCGITGGSGVSIDLQGVLTYKNSIVSKLTSYAARLLRSCRVRVEAGEASLKSAHEIVCRGRIYRVSKIILCGGSKVDRSVIQGSSHKGVWGNEDVFKTTEIPSRLVILSDNSEGCEIAATFAAFGSNVMLIGMGQRLLADWDAQVAEAVSKTLSEAGVKVHTGISVKEITDRNGSPYIITERGGVLCDKLLIATGRKPNLSFLGMLADDIKIKNGAISVNEYMETSVPGIFAVGDITGQSFQTQAIYKMARVAAANAMGGAQVVNSFAAPFEIKTTLEAASAGLTEEQAREKYGDGLITGFCPLSANVKSILSGKTTGFVKVLASRKHGEIYGVHIVGAEAAEMIAEPAALMQMEVTIHEVAADIIHAHPTYPEAFGEACADALGKSIHLFKTS